VQSVALSTLQPFFLSRRFFGFGVNSLLFGTTNLCVFFRDNPTSTVNFVDTGILPPAGYYWYQMAWDGASDFVWKVTGDLDPATVPIAQGTLSATLPLAPAPVAPSFAITGQTFGTLLPTSMDIDVVEVWTSTRS
jgi:hypothetical protein